MTDLGVRQTRLTAAERYEVQPDYKRFSQKWNMTRQRFWNPEAEALAKIATENRAKLVRARKAGYSVLDWAYYNASRANWTISGFGNNSPNHGPTSWTQLGQRPPEGIDKWSGDPAFNSRAVKKIAGLFGAGDVGITLLDRRWVYAEWFDEATGQSYPVKFSDEPGYESITEPTQLEDHTQVIPASMKYAVVLILPMNRQGVRAAPTLRHTASTVTTYSEMSSLILSVAEFIRGLGYNAIPSANCTALSIPLAIDAGLGELGRNAKLIHPVFGPICRICKVITDLPLEPDVPIQTLATTFCETCTKCADACPSRAIPRGPRSFEPVGEFNSAGVKQWQLDHWKCNEFSTKVGTNCGICLVACPFNKGQHWYHRITKAVIANVKPLHPLIRALDDALGYGKTSTDEFWN